MVFAGLSGGLLITVLGMVLDFKANWSMEFSRLLGTRFTYLGSLGIALGYIGLVMLICKSEGFKTLLRLLSPVGRMAFTNYILMTIVATLIFNGHGLGLFGSVERTGQLGIVLGIWLLVLFISPLWLNHFRYGPLEGIWRRLTYWYIPHRFLNGRAVNVKSDVN
jgi:uncharacterized protein